MAADQQSNIQDALLQTDRRHVRNKFSGDLARL